MLKRTVSAIVGIPLLIFLLIKGGILLYLATIIISIIGLYEFYNAMRFKNYNPINFIGYILSIVLLSILYFFKSTALILFFLFISIIILSGILLFNLKYTVKDISITLYGIIYISLFLGHIILVSKFQNKWIIWLIFIVAWSTDTFAYFGGYLWGNKKLCPNISPKKTIAGAITGIIGSILSCCLFGYIFLEQNILLIALFGFIGSIISQFGDLTASQIKRYTNVKDFGNLIPGHGGILDRFDSILFTAPFVYYFFLFFIR
ncbi:MAG: phosphatidate cytidylyltransferase [Clostridiales bacterium]|nr:phosphatidate cytidylyltransferase [Clostridiales bacterium]